MYVDGSYKKKNVIRHLNVFVKMLCAHIVRVLMSFKHVSPCVSIQNLHIFAIVFG